MKKATLQVEQIGGARVHLRNGRPVLIEDDGRKSGDDVLDDVAQWVGHPLESGEWKKAGDLWRVKVWFHEDCECSSCSAGR